MTLIDTVHDLNQRIERAARAEAELRGQRNELIALGDAMKISRTTLAEAAGISRAKLYLVLPTVSASSARSTAPDPPDADGLLAELARLGASTKAGADHTTVLISCRKRTISEFLESQPELDNSEAGRLLMVSNEMVRKIRSGSHPDVSTVHH